MRTGGGLVKAAEGDAAGLTGLFSRRGVMQIASYDSRVVLPGLLELVGIAIESVHQVEIRQALERIV